MKERNISSQTVSLNWGSFCVTGVLLRFEMFCKFVCSSAFIVIYKAISKSNSNGGAITPTVAQKKVNVESDCQNGGL